MKRRWTMLAAALALVAVGAIAGTAFAVSRGVALNGHASATTATPNFQSGTAVKVRPRR